MNKVFQNKPCNNKKIVAWLVLFLLFVIPQSFSYAGEDEYMEYLLNTADREKIHQERMWNVLLHYKQSVMRGRKSLIDDPAFFIADNGKINPESELRETIKSFFRTDVKDDEHPRCKFPARYKWLKRRLNIDETKLPQQKCEKLNNIMQMLNPKSAVLVFPTSHINSPATMFGHTLLRLDSEHESKLVSYAVNYSAFIDKERLDIFYAFKGIFGMYKGYFAVMPYYDKITEYGNIENRDMWEYYLNLSEEEVENMALHLWELQDIYSDYYFFDENCSYILLFLIESARPEVSLTGSFFYWVLPVDTIRVIKENGLISKVVYRPAKATRIKHIANLTGPEFQDLSVQIAKGQKEPEEIADRKDVSETDKIKALDLSAEYLQYLYAGKKLEKDEYSKRFINILSFRSKFGKYEHEIPVPSQPEDGHRTTRTALGAGIKNNKIYQSASFRFAYHDLLDPDEGYISGAAITFLETEIRYDYADNKFFLNKFTLLDINSLIERDRFFKNIAWKLRAGADREDVSKYDSRTIYTVNGGAGISKKIFSDWLIYGLIDADVKAGSRLDKNYVVGAGLSAGILKLLSGTWKAQLELKGISYELGDDHTVYSLQFDQRFKINQNNAIMLYSTLRRAYDFNSYDVSLKWNFYF